MVHLNQVILAPPQCGTASSCVKISRPTNMFDDWGRFVPRDQRRPPETLFRGCFVLDLKQDICHNARDGLRYCWCSSKDLCNSSTSIGDQVILLIFCYVWALSRLKPFILFNTIRDESNIFSVEHLFNDWPNTGPCETVQTKTDKREVDGCHVVVQGMFS